MMLLCLSVTVSATEAYSSQLEQSGFSDIADSLPDEIKDLFDGAGIDIYDPSSVGEIESAGAVKMILEFLRGGIEKPLAALGETVGIIIIYAAAVSVASEKSGMNDTLNHIFSVILILSLLKNIIACVTGSAAAIKGTAMFMTSLVPVFAGIVTVSGSPVNAAVSSGLLLLAAETIVQVCAFLIVPLMSGYLCLGVSSGVSPLIRDSGISSALKNIAMWSLGLIFTVFTGILSMQTTLAAASDTLGVKTAKFMVGSFVPVVGTGLSEALGAIMGSVSLLKNSVGIFAIMVIVAFLLPVIAELICWRVVMMISSAAAGMFSLPKIPVILKSVDSVFSVLIGITLFVGALFIISLAIITKAGG